MSILLVTIISMSENERRHNAKSVMSGLSHFYPPHHCLRTNCCAKLDLLLKSSNCNVLCVTKLRPMLKANYSIVMYRVVSGQNAPIV